MRVTSCEISFGSKCLSWMHIYALPLHEICLVGEAFSYSHLFLFILVTLLKFSLVVGRYGNDQA